MGFKFVHNLLGYRFETFGKSVFKRNEPESMLPRCINFTLFISIVLCSGCCESIALLPELQGFSWTFS